jgi:hypothetical protein
MKKTVKRKKNMPIYTGGKREKKKNFSSNIHQELFSTV